MPGLARCVICRREVEFEDSAPGRCRVREGGCGAAKSMSVLRLPGRADGTRRYDPDGDRERMLGRLRLVVQRHSRRLRP